MSETIEQAQEGLEHAHHAAGHGGGHESGRSVRWIAVLIAGLAAALALAEMQEKGSQNEYLTHHITLSDGWAYYQAKNLRAAIQEEQAAVLESLPNAADPAVQARIKRTQEEAARLRDDPKGGAGMKQLSERAKGIEEERDHAFHHYHLYELVVGALQISIVLASVSVVTRAWPLTLAAALIGCAAALFGLSVAFDLHWIDLI